DRRARLPHRRTGRPAPRLELPIGGRRQLHRRQLRRRLERSAQSDRRRQLDPLRDRGDDPLGGLRGADRLGRVAHRHAGQEPGAGADHRRLHHTPYLGSVGWILLGGPNAGWLNRAWMGLTGSSHGFMNVFSFEGMVLVTALYSFPYIFVFTSAALDLVSTEMEEAANILGSGSLRTIFRITLPLVLPAILGGAIIVFLDTIALFGVPAVIA